MPKNYSTFERIKGINTFAASIIGAGILALPIFLAEAGFWPGLLMIILTGGVCILSGLFIAESFLRVKEYIHLPCLALKFLGKKGYFLMFFGIFVCAYGALVGYLSGGGQIIHDISKGLIPIRLGILIYFSLGTLMIYLGIKTIKSASLYLFFLMMLLFLGLLGFTFSNLNFSLPTFTDWSAAPKMIGVLIFAFGAHTLIPSLGKEIKNDGKGLQKICAWGVFIPLILYSLWFFGIIFTVPYGEVPAETIAPLATKTLQEAKIFGQPATIPLAHLIGGQILILGNLFALISIFTSFLGFGLSGKDSLIDFSKKKVKKKLAIFLVVVPPLIFSLIHPTSFLGALDIAGFYGNAIFMGILPPLILLKSRKKTEKEPAFVVPGGRAVPIAVFLFFFFAILYKTIELL